MLLLRITGISLTIESTKRMTDDEIEQIKELQINYGMLIKILTREYPSVCGVQSVFIWDHHPLGYEFWSKENNHLVNCGALSKEAREELERIIIIKELT